MTLIGFRPVLFTSAHPVKKSLSPRFGNQEITTFEQAIERLKSQQVGDGGPQVADYLTWAEPGHYAFTPYADQYGYCAAGFGPYLYSDNAEQRKLKPGDYLLIGDEAVLNMHPDLAASEALGPAWRGKRPEEAFLWKITDIKYNSYLSKWNANVEAVNTPPRPASEIERLIKAG